MQELKVEDNISKTQKGALRASSRKTVQQQPQQTFKDSFKNKCTNFVYKLNAFQVPNIFRKNTQHSMISLFGQQYSNEQDAKRALQQTVWFTYRSRFKVSQDLNSDSGWGCLLRVGQMILATALKKYFACRLNYSINQDSIENIIYAFLDDNGPQQKYSILSMMKIAQKQFCLRPGQWFNIGQIGFILEKIQNKRPMKGSNNLKVLTFNQSIIFLQQAFSALKIPMCKCQNRKIACKICHKMFISECRANKIIERQVIQTQILQTKRENSQQIDQKQYYKKQKQHAKDIQQNCLNEQQQFDLPRHLLLIVVVRLSVKNIPKNSFDGVLQLISHYTSIGIIGGIPKKALYFTGRCNQELVYLDPHYVQQSVNRRSFENLRGTFHCQEFRKMQYTQIDPSMGLGFYIKNLRDLQSLAVLMAKLKQRKKNDFISIMWGNMDIERKSSEFSQSFEFCQLSDDQNQQDFS